jgi:hypothetical protein
VGWLNETASVERNPGPCRAALLDLDGVLMDSRQVMKDALHAAWAAADQPTAAGLRVFAPETGALSMDTFGTVPPVLPCPARHNGETMKGIA